VPPQWTVRHVFVVSTAILSFWVIDFFVLLISSRLGLQEIKE
jgi:hypothetical protein